MLTYLQQGWPATGPLMITLVVVLLIGLLLAIGQIAYRYHQAPGSLWKSRGLSRRGKYMPQAVPTWQPETAVLKAAQGRWKKLSSHPMLWPLLAYGLAALAFVFFSAPALWPVMLILLGLMMMYIGYELLGLLKPQPQFAVTPGHPTPGSTVMLEWRFPRHAERITKLQIILRGYEKVYGNNNPAAWENANEQLFYEVVLLETVEATEIAQGTLTLEMPEFVPMSFKTKNQEIKWIVCAEWATPYWPELTHEYILQVAPGPLEEP